MKQFKDVEKTKIRMKSEESPVKKKLCEALSKISFPFMEKISKLKLRVDEDRALGPKTNSGDDSIYTILLNPEEIGFSAIVIHNAMENLKEKEALKEAESYMLKISMMLIKKFFEINKIMRQEKFAYEEESASGPKFDA